MTPKARVVAMGALVACALAIPLAARDAPQQEKQLYQAYVPYYIPPTSVYFQAGQGMLVVSDEGFDFLVQDQKYGLDLTRVTLTIAGDHLDRRVVLCDDAGGLTCDRNTRIRMRGTLDEARLLGAENGPVTPEEFREALADGLLQLAFQDGEFGFGAFYRVR